jgi:uncharacterized membrane protein
MDIEQTIEIDAPPEVVWSVMQDVERWPEWTASTQRVKRLDDGPFALGSRARIKQPGFPEVEWQVTSIEPGRSFAWETRAPGQHMVGIHRIEPTDSGSRVTLGVRSSGPVAVVIGLLFGGRARNFVEIEARGLKRRSEGLATRGV